MRAFLRQHIVDDRRLPPGPGRGFPRARLGLKDVARPADGEADLVVGEAVDVF